MPLLRLVLLVNRIGTVIRPGRHAQGDHRKRDHHEHAEQTALPGKSAVALAPDTSGRLGDLGECSGCVAERKE